MMAGFLARLLRKQLCYRSKFVCEWDSLKNERYYFNEIGLKCREQRMTLCKAACIPHVSLSAKIISEKKNHENIIDVEEENRVKTLKELNKNLNQLEHLVESKLKSAKAAYLEEDEDEVRGSVTNVRVSNSSKTVEIFGTPDPSQAISSTPCPGCGAKLHCKDPGIPGYIASQIFLSKQPSDLKNQTCQRCQLLKSKKIALDLNVQVDKYGPITREIRRHSALIVLLIDMTDPSNSFHPIFKQLLSPKRPMFIIGNKVDLLPKDLDGYLKRSQDSLVSIADLHGFNQSANVVHFDLISAKTGFRVEELISKMLKFWRLKGNVFIIGCTNSGKSTLYNSLLASDFCRSSATEVLSRATTSNWPGTTLSLLKFPILNPKPEKLRERERRLKREGSSVRMEEALDESFKNKDAPNLHSPLPTTFLTPTRQALTQLNTQVVVPTYSFHAFQNEDPMHSHIGLSGAAEYLSLKVRPYDDSTFKFWCFDTPGLVNQEQIVNLLSPEELSLSIVTTRQIQARTYIVKPSQTVFVSGFGRIDYLEGRDNIHFCFYTSPHLPIHTIPTSEADDFYQSNVGTPTLGIPIATNNNTIPPLEGRDYKVVGRGMKEASADVVLSSIGWVSVSPRQNQPILLRAYTPHAKGLLLRQPPLIMYPFNNMGKRIQGTNRYSYKKAKLGSNS